MNTYQQIETVIRNRRTVKPAQMNGKKIDDQQVQQLLELADWAPTHAFTEPWRFVVYGGSAVQQFCRDHAALYKAHTPAEKFAQPVYDRFATMGDTVSHLVIAYAKRAEGVKIPVVEEIAAASCAIQNLLLGAEALGIASFWSTGGMVLQPAMKQYFQLGEQDTVLGLLYLGYSDEVNKTGKRLVPLEQKIQWHR